VVVPLMPRARAPLPAHRLNPVLMLNGAPQVMVTQFLSAVPAALLTGTPVSLLAQSDAISNALDLLLTGV
jgi:toxin CcdB